MVVGMWMTRDPLTIDPETPIVRAAEIMARRHVRRLPVVMRHGQREILVGIITTKDVLHAFPPHVNPFAVLGPGPNSTPDTAADIMTRDVQVTTPDTLIEEAAALMAAEKVGSLPVLRDGHLVGLITESDIFRAFASFFETPEGGVRITFDASTGEDLFGFVSEEAARRSLRVLSVITSTQNEFPVCVVRVAGDQVDAFVDDLWRSGHRVLHVRRSP
jgi:acetoin utilization protein AcuB